MENRLFFSQAAIDRWMSDGSAELCDGHLTLAAGRRFELAEALHVLREVSGAGDPHDLVGRVKVLAQLAELGADVVETSMLIGDSAYDVERGWLGVPVGTLAGRSASTEKKGDPAETDLGACDAAKIGAGGSAAAGGAQGREAKAGVTAGEAHEADAVEEAQRETGAAGAEGGAGAKQDPGNGDGPARSAAGADRTTRKRRTKG